MTTLVALGEPIVLDGWLPPRELSPNARVHHMARYRHAKAAMQTVWGAVTHAQWPGQAFVDGPRLLRITMRRKGRTLDQDNAYALVKALVDGVKWAGALYDDSPRYCRLEVRQERGAPQTVLELFEDAVGG